MHWIYCSTSTCANLGYQKGAINFADDDGGPSPRVLGKRSCQFKVSGLSCFLPELEGNEYGSIMPDGHDDEGSDDDNDDANDDADDDDEADEEDTTMMTTMMRKKIKKKKKTMRLDDAV